MILDASESAKAAAVAAAARLATDPSQPPEYFPSPNPSIRSNAPSVSASSSLQPPPQVVIARGDGEDETLLTAHLRDDPLASQEVVLSWAGADSADLPREVLRQTELLQSASMPPSYASSRTITSSMAFSFSPSSFNTMLLLPPPTAQDSRPLFNVHISLNCFNPGSYITTLRRGGSPENGEYVGEFEMGVSLSAATVTIGNVQQRLEPTVLHGWSKKGKEGIYYWRFHKDPARQLTWRRQPNNLVCTLGFDRHTVATFRSTPLLPRADGVRHPPPTLEIWPRAYNDPAVLADVVMSTLVLERKRLTAHTDAVN